MSEKSPENNNRREIREAIESLSPSKLSYGIALMMNHRYDFGGYSVGRSERSYLLDMYLSLNRDYNSEVMQLDPFNNGELFLKIAQLKIKPENEGGRIELNIHDVKDLSCLILRMWIKHYREKVGQIVKGSFSTDTDFSFESEIKRAELVYGLYIQENSIDEDLLDRESENFVNNDFKDLNKYKPEFRWLVDDITKI